MNLIQGSLMDVLSHFGAQACRRIQLLVAFMRLLDCSTFSISDKTRRRQVTEST